ncbi:hypothetical protein [Neptunomonas qingdaonensis]|nr:hypothetical protein [Neptunomonas qingdaonensis]
MFSSVKCNRVFFCESALEVNALLWLEFDDAITYYETQPDSFEYYFQGRKRRYTPDLRVFQEEKSNLEEIKPFSKCQSDDFKLKYGALTHLFSSMGETLSLTTDREVYVGDAVSNFRLLYRYLSEPLNSNQLDRFQAKHSTINMSWEELKHRLHECRYPPTFAFQLLAYGYLDYDYLKHISNAMEVTSAS